MAAVLVVREKVDAGILTQLESRLTGDLALSLVARMPRRTCMVARAAVLLVAVYSDATTPAE